MRLAAAQTVSRPDDVQGNLLAHLRFVQEAAAQDVQVLMFPELSLTGYELASLSQHRFDAGTAAFAQLQAAADRHGMVLVVGAPAAARPPTQPLPSIGAWVFQPGQAHTVYCKRHLHAGEEAYASPGLDDAKLIKGAGADMAVAVCADVTHPEHAAAAARAGATVYLASMLISAAGYPADAALAQARAQQHGMAVLLANHGGPTGGYAAAGRSAFWSPDGALLAQTPGDGEWLLVAQRDAAGWAAQALAVQP